SLVLHPFPTRRSSDLLDQAQGATGPRRSAWGVTRCLTDEHRHEVSTARAVQAPRRSCPIGEARQGSGSLREHALDLAGEGALRIAQQEGSSPALQRVTSSQRVQSAQRQGLALLVEGAALELRVASIG